MSKYNAFGSFADAVEPKKKPVVEQSFHTDGEDLTVEELIKVLQTMIEKNPAVAEMKICVAEGYSMSDATSVEAMSNGKVIVGA